MFNALNRFIGQLDGEPDERGGMQSAAGFQVLKNSNPDLPLEPWFDFIIGINGRNLVCGDISFRSRGNGSNQKQDNADPGLFATEIRNCAGSTVSLGVWTA